MIEMSFKFFSWLIFEHLNHSSMNIYLKKKKKRRHIVTKGCNEISEFRQFFLFGKRDRAVSPA